MLKKHRHGNFYIVLAGVPVRYCGECGRIQRKFVYKKGWETASKRIISDTNLSDWVIHEIPKLLSGKEGGPH